MTMRSSFAKEATHCSFFFASLYAELKALVDRVRLKCDSSMVNANREDYGRKHESSSLSFIFSCD